MSNLVTNTGGRSNAHLINRIRLVKGDITAQTGIDAVVASIEIDMKMDGTLNQAMLAAAGERLDEFILENIYKPRKGDAFALPPFGLPVKHIIYVITPNWRGGIDAEDRDLLNCYRRAIRLAHRMELKSIAFPALGTGANKYPLERAARLAVQGIMDRLTGQLDEIRIVCNRDDTYQAFSKRLKKTGWKGKDV